MENFASKSSNETRPESNRRWPSCSSAVVQQQQWGRPDVRGARKAASRG